MAEVYPNIKEAVLDEFFLAAKVPYKCSGHHSNERVRSKCDSKYTYLNLRGSIIPLK